MSKYIIEGNINFQEELYKLLDEDSENEDELCQITGLPLTDKHIVLECNHHFNYDALYKEIVRQKYEFKTYEPYTLQTKYLQKFRDSKLDYFIKCPYCRNIQFTVLPYYKELGLKEIYGINSLNKTFKIYGVTFQSGECCEKINTFGDTCQQKYTTIIPNTQLSYCRIHYKRGLKSYKMSEKKKILDAKIEAKKKKDYNMNQKKKLLEEMNTERESKGLAPLKRLPVVKKKIENIIEQGHTIQQYIPDDDICCIAILKSGANKGKTCGCKKIEANGLCKRHIPKDEKKMMK